ncbi:hypothetical protein IU487_33345 [Nocardia puris]|uniref:hypothetical protein n=1 Tax=Nocardia puris TaxID=208602 RepID=UPI000B008EE1|nr:hypothetical protein [Nocardia puris]MBF6215885.1 hypothetical protein [Nocardia puris]
MPTTMSVSSVWRHTSSNALVNDCFSVTALALDMLRGTPENVSRDASPLTFRG